MVLPDRDDDKEDDHGAEDRPPDSGQAAADGGERTARMARTSRVLKSMGRIDASAMRVPQASSQLSGSYRLAAWAAWRPARLPWKSENARVISAPNRNIWDE